LKLYKSEVVALFRELSYIQNMKVVPKMNLVILAIENGNLLGLKIA
jgi:hypothetical protein